MTQSRENSGALFKRDKQGNENRPDYSGPINVDGVDKELAAWIREDRNGNKYMSLKVSDPYKPQQTQHHQSKANGYQADNTPDFDQDVPF